MRSANEKLINDFISHLKKQRKSRSTIIAYKKDIEQLADSATKSLTKISAKDIQKFMSEMELTPKTLSRKLNSFRTFYRHLIDNGVIAENPAMAVEHPKFKPSKPRVLSPVEYLALRQVSNDNLRLYTMIELMLQTGIRIGELSRLKVSDVDIKKTRGYLHVAEFSTNPSRRVELNSKAVNILKKYLKITNKINKNSALFSTRDNKPIIIRNIRSSIDRAIEKAGIENACVNDLRNTFIVHQLASNVSMDYITDTVGHKSKATTSRYLELLSKPYKGNGEGKIQEL